MRSRELVNGTPTGVYIGMCTNEYSHLTTADMAKISAWTGTGSALSIASNRLSYLLDLRGPSMTLDTACSSSLVAVHQACDSLRRGECDAMLSGGVNLILAPDLTTVFTRAGMMSPSSGALT